MDGPRGGVVELSREERHLWLAWKIERWIYRQKVDFVRNRTFGDKRIWEGIKVRRGLCRSWGKPKREGLFSSAHNSRTSGQSVLVSDMVERFEHLTCCQGIASGLESDEAINKG